MKATLEISMYPLNEHYEKDIIAFIKRLKSHDRLRVEVNGISTQVYGEYDELMPIIHQETKRVLESSRTVFVMKIAAGERDPASLPDELKQP